MALLVTPTLFDSIDWYNNCPQSWKQRAYKGLSDTLNRRWNPTPAITRGINFEKQICHGTNPVNEVREDLREKFMEAYNMIHAKGHDFQKKAKRIVEYNDREYCLYGKEDVHFDLLADYENGLIIDIKTTGNYRGKQSYLKKWQHKFYTWLTGIRDFKYIVFEFGDGPKDSDAAALLVNIHIIDYHNDDYLSTEKEIMTGIEKMANFFNAHKDLKKAYLQTFNMYN